KARAQLLPGDRMVSPFGISNTGSPSGIGELDIPVARPWPRYQTPAARPTEPFRLARDLPSNRAMDSVADMPGPILPSQNAPGGDPPASGEARFSRVIGGDRGYGQIEVMGRAEPVSAALALVGLTGLMREGKGDPSISVGIIDGPLDLEHPAFATSSLRTVKLGQVHVCREARSVACSHGTAIAGILCAERGSPAPAICPACTFLLYPIFPADDDSASVTPGELARAIV